MHFSTAKLVSNLNRQLYATTAPEKYATFYFAIYDDLTQTLRYTNAGHLAPILVCGGSLSTHGFDRHGGGRVSDRAVRRENGATRAGDMLVAYTDGSWSPRTPTARCSARTG